MRFGSFWGCTGYHLQAFRSGKYLDQLITCGLELSDKRSKNSKYPGTSRWSPLDLVYDSPMLPRGDWQSPVISFPKPRVPLNKSAMGLFTRGFLAKHHCQTILPISPTYLLRFQTHNRQIKSIQRVLFTPEHSVAWPCLEAGVMKTGKALFCLAAVVRVGLTSRPQSRRGCLDLAGCAQKFRSASAVQSDGGQGSERASGLQCRHGPSHVSSPGPSWSLAFQIAC